MPAPAILVVDDTEANRVGLARRLTRHGYRVEEAADGETALTHLQTGAFDLVLLDVMMPGMSGLEVLARVRLTTPATALPVIMATANDAPADMVEAFELGASDYVTKPIDFPVLLARVRTHIALKQATDELARQANRLKHDLRRAAEVQRAALPARPPAVSGLAFAWGYAPCDELAGDFFGVHPLPAGGAACYLLDVSGHGIAAALLAVAIGRTLNSPAGDPDSLLTEADGSPTSPAEVVARLSARFPMDDRSEQFFTMWYAVADGATGRVRFAAAGHPPALHLGAAAVPLAGAGLPGGVGHKYADHELTLAPGEAVVVYSDGVTEAAGPGGELFGVDRLRAVLTTAADRSPRGLVDAVEAAVKAWAGGTALKDDVSVLAVGRV